MFSRQPHRPHKYWPPTLWPAFDPSAQRSPAIHLNLFLLRHDDAGRGGPTFGSERHRNRNNDFFDQHFWIWIFGGAGLETEGSLYMTIRGCELIPLPLKHDGPFHVWPLPRVGAKPSPGRQNRRRCFWQLKRVRPPLIDSKKCVCVCVRV